MEKISANNRWMVGKFVKNKNIIPNWTQHPLQHMNIYLTIFPFPFAGFCLSEGLGLLCVRGGLSRQSGSRFLMLTPLRSPGYAIFGFCVELVFAIYHLAFVLPIMCMFLPGHVLLFLPCPMRRIRDVYTGAECWPNAFR